MSSFTLCRVGRAGPAIALLTIAAGLCVAQTNTGTNERAMDRIVHIEPEIILEIPQAPPLCDSLDHLSRQRIDIGDCELYCEQAGEGVPIVLVSGGPGTTHHSFHPAFCRAENFARVIYYDQRGTGRSDAEPGEGFTVEQAVDDLDRLREALGVEKWIVLGHSYGGKLAQCYAVTHPQRLAGLVLIGSATAMQIELEPGREQTFISDEERRRIRQIYDTPDLSLEQVVYNSHLNGDWKRQNYYRPTREQLARTALYEWKPAPGFRNAISQSSNNVDLKGAFEGCPIPTLIVEGTWDLTWNTDKPGKLHANHPNARLVMFEASAHNPFDDEPEKFFSLLRDLATGLPEIESDRVEAWRGRLATWREELEQSPDYILRSAMSVYGMKSSAIIADAFSGRWLDELEDFRWFMTIGQALYDLNRDEEALAVFRRMHAEATDDYDRAVALIWQGHMLDLLKRRDEAIGAYRAAFELDVSGRHPMRHDQYGLAYYPKCYALERTKVPFTRLENVWDELIAK